MTLSVSSFFQYYMFYPEKAENDRDKAIALISTIALGIFTLGFAHLISYLCHFPLDFNKTVTDGPANQASDMKTTTVYKKVIEKDPGAGAWYLGNSAEQTEESENEEQGHSHVLVSSEEPEEIDDSSSLVKAISPVMPLGVSQAACTEVSELNQKDAKDTPSPKPCESTSEPNLISPTINCQDADQTETLAMPSQTSIVDSEIGVEVKGPASVAYSETHSLEEIKNENFDQAKVKTLKSPCLSESLEDIVHRAEKGEAEYQFAYGLLYLSGEKGVKASNIKAQYWLRRAADQKHVNSMYEIGKLLDRISLKREDKRSQEAQDWFLKCYDLGFEKAKKRLA